MTEAANAGGGSDARLTGKEKGKGKRKRLASVDQADKSVGDDGEDGDNGQDIVDTTERQFTRSKRRDTGQVSHQFTPRRLKLMNRLLHSIKKVFRLDSLLSLYHPVYSTTKT